MKDLDKFLTEKQDIEILHSCEQQTEKMINSHIDLVEDLNFKMLQENDEADKRLQKMLEF